MVFSLWEALMRTMPTDTTCHCPACSPGPRASFTEDFKLDCQARLYGHFTAKQQARFLEALQRQPGWEKHLQAILDRLETLKREGRFETAFWEQAVSRQQKSV